MKSKQTGLPYVLSCDSKQQDIKKTRLRAALLFTGAFFELLFATKSYMNFDQVMGALWTAASYPTFAGALAHGIMAEKNKEELEKN